MEEDGGYDYEVVDKKLFDELYCPVCVKLMKDAMELTCEHSLCSSCLNKWQVKASEMNTPFTCPQCRLIISTEMVQRNGTINRIIQTLVMVKCTQNLAGCEWVGVISDVEDHITQTCTLTEINCTHANCEEPVPRGSLPEHLSTCNFRLVSCDHCSEDLVRNQLEDHLLECEMFPVQCDNEECEAVVSRKLIQQHKDEECEYKSMDCQYTSIGCEAKFPRSRQDDHENQSVASHISLLHRNNVSVNKKMEAIESELMRTKEILLKREDYLESLEEQVAEITKKEQRTTDILNHTIDRLETKEKELVKMKQKIENLEEGLQEKTVDLKQTLAVNSEELTRATHRKETTLDFLNSTKEALSGSELRLRTAENMLNHTIDRLGTKDKELVKMKQKIENLEEGLLAKTIDLKQTLAVNNEELTRTTHRTETTLDYYFNSTKEALSRIELRLRTAEVSLEGIRKENLNTKQLLTTTQKSFNAHSRELETTKGKIEDIEYSLKDAGNELQWTNLLLAGAGQRLCNAEDCLETNKNQLKDTRQWVEKRHFQLFALALFCLFVSLYVAVVK